MDFIYSNLMTEQRLLGKRFRLLLTVSLLAVFSAGIAWAGPPIIADGKADVTVYKTEFCGCCTKWTDHLEKSGFDVNVITVNDTSPVRTRLGVPRELASCHTAVVGNYWVEGHVPADLLSQLLQQQPANIKGIAVPGMPPGSPGMEVPNPSAYQILSVDNDGKVGWYATRMGRSTR